jgi:hypothetical protein
MNFHGVSLGNPHEILLKQHNGKVSAADCLQRPLLRRSRFRQRLTATVKDNKTLKPNMSHGELGAIFKRWYPDMDLEVEEISVAA